jgi:hypothetical protein
MRKIILSLGLITSLSFSAVLTADRYEIYTKSAHMEMYVNGQLVRSQDYSTGLGMVFEKQESGDYLVKALFSNVNFVVNNDCVITRGSGTYKKGSNVCPVDPKKPTIIVWIPLDVSGSQAVPATLYRGLDNDDVNHDGETDDIIYEGYASYGPLDITYTRVYDGKTGKLEYEEADIINSQTYKEGYLYFSYDVKIQSQKPQPKPSPQPLPPPERIPTGEDILEAF